MRRIFCDGCHKAGIMNDITDLPASERRKIQVTRAQILDLCCARCVPVYDRFDFERQRLLSAHTQGFVQQMSDLMSRFWMEVSSAEKPS